MDAIDQVRAYYDENTEKEWLRMERHPFEFLLTQWMMDKYIKPGDTVLDIGGGPGRYSLYYREKGCPVTLLDLSPGNIAWAKKEADARGLTLDARVCNCLELEGQDLPLYDHVLLMGPLYHLTDAGEQRRAVELALRQLKPGGVFYCSFILDFAGLIYDMSYGPGILPQDLADPATGALIDSITQRTLYRGPAFTSACFINQAQIEPFMAPFGLKKLHLFGQEGILSPLEQRIKTYPQEEIDLWVETAKKLLELPEFLSWAQHAMYIGRK